MTKYIEITQDAAGIIFNQNGCDYSGFYTTEIETCVVIAVQASLGMCLIHHSGRLSQSSISQLLAQIGDIQTVNLFIHRKKNDLKNLKIIFNQDLFKDINPTLNYTNGSVSIYRDFTWSIDDLESKYLIVPVKRELRIATNNLNNLLEKELTVDIQFDGKNFSPCTGLSKPMSEISKLLIAPQKLSQEQKMILRAAIQYYDYQLKLDNLPQMLFSNLSFVAQLNSNLGAAEAFQDDEKVNSPRK